jgi:hypothetical protein
MQRLENRATASIDNAATELGLLIEPGTKPVRCDSAFVYRGKALGSCSWSNATGTMTVYLRLMQPWPPKKNTEHDGASWVLANAGATVCEVEK